MSSMVAVRRCRRALAVAMLLVAGCRIGSKPGAVPGDAGVPTLGTAAPGQFSDLAPGDTAGVIVMMRQTMGSIDAGLDAMIRRDTILPPGADATSRQLTVWLQGGAPRKLVVVDSTGHGQHNTETEVWFIGGDVAVLLQMTDAYAFDGDRIVLWTDEALQPRIDATSDAMMVQQAALVKTVRGWLGVLGFKLP